MIFVRVKAFTRACAIDGDKEGMIFDQNLQKKKLSMQNSMTFNGAVLKMKKHNVDGLIALVFL